MEIDMHVQSIHFKDLEFEFKDLRWGTVSGSFVASYHIDWEKEGEDRIQIDGYSRLVAEVKWWNRNGNVRKIEKIREGDDTLVNEFADAVWIGYIKGIINDGVE